MPPSWGANALLHPARRPRNHEPTGGFEKVELRGDGGVALKGWLFRTEKPRRGTIVYLHGLSDNRGTGVAIASHFVARGFDVLAYDSRAHGESGGDACTYGYYEKRDLARAIDWLHADDVVLLGSSMGAAVALQAAAEDHRVKGVVAIATISDLRTAAFERAPFIASRGNVESALRMSEQQGKFRVDEVSPVAAAARIAVPVMLIHGEKDPETPAAHSKRVYDALPGRRRLVLVPNAKHNDTLTTETWKQVDAWVDESLAKASTGTTDPSQARRRFDPPALELPGRVGTGR
jgi:pimeloyl-ACP methyl ester carboxylesterase